MMIRMGEVRVALTPFIFIAAAWVLLGSFITLGYTADPYTAVLWFFLFFLIAVLDLFFLVKTIAVIFVLMSHERTEKRALYSMQLLFWGALKLAALGLILVGLWKSEQGSGLSVVLGLGTLVIVPLFGGYLWSRNELAREDSEGLNHARRT